MKIAIENLTASSLAEAAMNGDLVAEITPLIPEMCDVIARPGDTKVEDGRTLIALPVRVPGQAESEPESAVVWFDLTSFVIQSIWREIWGTVRPGRVGVMTDEPFTADDPRYFVINDQGAGLLDSEMPLMIRLLRSADRASVVTDLLSDASSGVVQVDEDNVSLARAGAIVVQIETTPERGDAWKRLVATSVGLDRIASIIEMPNGAATIDHHEPRAAE